MTPPAPGRKCDGPRSAPDLLPLLVAAVAILVELARVRVAQGPRPVTRGGRGEAVAAWDVEVAVLERGRPGHVLIPDPVSLGTRPGHRGVDVARRPQKPRPENVRRYFKPSQEAIAELTCLLAPGDSRR